MVDSRDRHRIVHEVMNDLHKKIPPRRHHPKQQFLILANEECFHDIYDYLMARHQMFGDVNSPMNTNPKIDGILVRLVMGQPEEWLIVEVLN